MKFTRLATIAPGLLLLSLTLLTGCHGEDIPSPSSWYPTNSIFAYMKAVQDESGSVTTTVQLRDAPGSAANYLYLSSGDVLYSSLNVPPRQYLNFNDNLFSNALETSQHLKVMSSRDLYTDYYLLTHVVAGKPEYFSQDTPDSSSMPVRAYVGFERPGQAMVESSVELPAAFQILTPAGEATISRSAPVTLTWTNVDAATTMELDVAGICTDGSRDTLHLSLGTDTGSATLDSAAYLPAGLNLSGNCRVAFLLQRVLIGYVPNFAFGSSFTGVQQRVVQFTSTP